MDECKFYAKLICDSRDPYRPSEQEWTLKAARERLPFSAASIWADDDAILPPFDLLLDIPYHQRLRP
jgi:hypothetical protein